MCAGAGQSAPEPQLYWSSNFNTDAVLTQLSSQLQHVQNVESREGGTNLQLRLGKLSLDVLIVMLSGNSSSFFFSSLVTRRETEADIYQNLLLAWTSFSAAFPTIYVGMQRRDKTDSKFLLEESGKAHPYRSRPAAAVSIHQSKLDNGVFPAISF